MGGTWIGVWIFGGLLSFLGGGGGGCWGVGVNCFGILRGQILFKFFFTFFQIFKIFFLQFFKTFFKNFFLLIYFFLCFVVELD